MHFAHKPFDRPKYQVQTAFYMELRHLNYFLAVADELSFSAAARTLHISQSALSRAVKDLEEEVGVQLLERTTSMVKLTPEGDRFIDLAIDIVDSVSDAVREIRQMGASPAKRIDVGYITPALDGFLQDAMAVTTQRHPDLDLHLHELNPQAQTKQLENKALDIALIGGTCKELMNQFDLFTVCKIPLKLLVPESHRLASRRSIRLVECRDEDFIGLKEDTFPGRNHAIRSCCDRAGFAPSFAHTADSLNSLMALVKTGRGICLVPADLESMLLRGLVLVPIRSPICSIEFSAAVAKNERRTPVRLFLEEYRKIAKRSVAEY